MPRTQSKKWIPIISWMRNIMGSDWGILKKVIIRKKWPDEASDFTPWLAREDNIEMLSSALGLELPVENTEVSVGPYSADILAKDAGTDCYVVIENKVASVALPQLLQMKEEIEAEIGVGLEWDPNPENQDKIISFNQDADLTKRDNWVEYLDWLTDMTIKFRKTFSKRVKSLDLTKRIGEPQDTELT